jgi:hypothetical protein
VTARRAFVAAVVAVALAAGCGDDGPAIAPAAARALTARLGELRAAVEAEDREAAERALDRLIASAERWAGRDRIEDDRLERILAAARVVAADLSVLPAASYDPSFAPDAPSSDTDLDGPAADHDTGPPPHAEAHGGGKDESKGKGKDESKGKGKDESKGKGKDD